MHGTLVRELRFLMPFGTAKEKKERKKRKKERKKTVPSLLRGLIGTAFVIQDLTDQGLVQFSRSVVSDSLQPHGLQHARPPCPSPTPGVYSNSCP